MSFIKEFEIFCTKGNIMDLAVGVIIGAAFTKIVDALVTDILMPILGIIVGPGGFANAYVVLGGAEKINAGMSLADARKTGANILAWGNFLTVVIDFIAIAFIIFLMVRSINHLREHTKNL